MDSDDIPCFNETQRFMKALTGPRVAFIWSFPVVQEQNLTNCYLETCWNCLVGYSRQARMNRIAVQLPSPSHSTVISVADIRFKQTQLIQRGRQQCRNMQERCWQGLLSLHSFLKIPDQFTVSKKTAELNFSQIINILKKKDRFLPRNTSPYL